MKISQSTAKLAVAAWNMVTEDYDAMVAFAAVIERAMIEKIKTDRKHQKQELSPARRVQIDGLVRRMHVIVGSCLNPEAALIRLGDSLPVPRGFLGEILFVTLSGNENRPPCGGLFLYLSLRILFSISFPSSRSE